MKETLKEGLARNVNLTLSGLTKKPKVIFHPGGIMFKSDGINRKSGWYLVINSVSAFEVDVEIVGNLGEIEV